MFLPEMGLQPNFMKRNPTPGGDDDDDNYGGGALILPDMLIVFITLIQLMNCQPNELPKNIRKMQIK